MKFANFTPKAVALLLSFSHITMADACCSALENAGLKVLRSGTEAFETQEKSYFSVSAQLSPYCIVQPTSAAEVSLAVTTLKTKTDCNWAVRSGGHMTSAGAANIDNGVTIDMGLMNKTEYSAETKLAHIGAGARWADVYKALEPFGVTAPGGRTSTVGVMGFLTGGGNNFFSAQVGLGCDNVVNFEIVLASGEIIQANRETHADLHKALKGGIGTNFGIVTSVDMQTVDTTTLWGGMVGYPFNTTEQQISTFVKWVDNISSHPSGSAITLWVYTPQSGLIATAALQDTSNQEWAPAFQGYKSIEPKLSDTTRHDSHLNFTVELEEPLGYRQVWLTLTGKNDARVVRRAVEAGAAFVENWKATQDPDFLTYFTFQAMDKQIFQHSVEKGGNVLGMDDPNQGDAILFQVQHMVRSEAAEKDAREQLGKMQQEIRDYYVKEGIYNKWEYINYADSSQDPLRSYGAENVQFIRDVAAKYDPDQVFQNRVPGGFKISNVV